MVRSRLFPLAPGALAALAGLCPAQRTVVVQNLAPFARREVVAAVVPFAEGEVPDLPALHVPEQPTEWQPFGARWPDGSLRQALCLFECELPALAEVEVELVEGPGPAPRLEPIPMPPARLEFVLRTGDRTVRAVPERVRDLESNALRRVELRRCRLGDTGLLAEVIVTACRDQPHAYVDLAVFFSDPTVEAMQLAVDDLSIRTRGMALLCRHAHRLGVWQKTTDDGSEVTLLHENVIGDGQGLRRCAALVPPLSAGEDLANSSSRAACVAPLLAATSWRETGAFGAFGVVPEMPPWLAGKRLRAHLAARHRRFVAAGRERRGPFDRPPLILAKNAGRTGDQDDFGVVKLALVAHSGRPSPLLEAEASVLQEACRPVHFFEADGSMVDPADHPDWVVWSGRTHWHREVSPDRLGKPYPPPRFETHGWTGKDRQHWSSNHLGAFALLTGAHWARRELRHEIQLYLAGQTTDPAKSTSGAGAPRGAGRTLQAASWMHLATGDPRVVRRMNERIDRVYFPQWTGRTLPPDRVRPMGVAPPDPRLLGGSCPYWNPWQEALAVIGFGAAYAITENPRAKELAEELAKNCTRHGWRVTDHDCQIAVALRWQDGEPLREDQLDDPEAAHFSHSFNPWAIASLEVARSAALREGDDDLAARAEALLRCVRSGRRPPRDGGPDRSCEWDAVLWPPR